MNLKQYFNSKGIRYWEHGKNVSRGWVNTTCPFCGDHAYSGNNHLGVSPELYFNCWICGAKGYLPKLIKKIEKVNWKKAYEIASQIDKSIIIKQNSAETKFPKGITNTPLEYHKNYLKNRGFNPNYIFKKYPMKFGGLIGDYRYHIIAGIHNWDSWIAADCTRKRLSKYRMSPIEESVISVKHTLYGLEFCNSESVIICEGLLDQWRFGDNSAATLGTKATPEQIAIIKDFENVYMIFDSGEEATKRATDIAHQIEAFCNVEVLELSSGDPADLKQEQADEIKNNLKLN